MKTVMDRGWRQERLNDGSPDNQLNPCGQYVQLRAPRRRWPRVGLPSGARPRLAAVGWAWPRFQIRRDWPSEPLARDWPEAIVEPKPGRRPFGDHRRRRAALHDVRQGRERGSDCARLEDRQDNLGTQLRRALLSQDGLLLRRRAALD